MATDLRCHTVQHFSEAFASLEPGRKIADLTNPHLSATLPLRVLTRIDNCIAALRAGRFPTVVGGAGSKSFATFKDDSAIYVPQSPLHDVGEETLSRCVQHAMLTMLESSEVDDECETLLKQVCVHAPPLPVDGLRLSEQAVDLAVKTLRQSLGRTPARRYRRRGVIPVVPDQQAVSSNAQLVHEDSLATIAADLPDVLPSQSSSQLDTSFTASTDPEGVSSQAPSVACSGDESDESDDTRSPACTSGSDFGF